MFESYNYWISIFIMMVGLFGVITRGNLVKKMMSLAIFQVSVLLFYISVGSIEGGLPPIRVDMVMGEKNIYLLDGEHFYTNPLPHVLMLTAIVVGVAVIAVGLAIIVRIKEEYGTIEEDEILKLDNEFSKNERENS
ncbi:MAG: cation:proton antiporter subunit C [Rickettsiales bacterium]|nr:cation:proton antiporter subunit C [Pseudomonadota bacterium]MDA0967269.1 cation:proton antiporter subunit C [Pseudomonadota bacterium]MDG4544070.1 cation:proton antiporter subunit C [Rickettsiales bacterium]MDG4546236.1 cation:proton antiporter subunit C [Rickettsiales bacterium]MDG4548394.1 cation:proton antiporter subunit C [Rickettsiales bacterium]